tara:strand:+ start:235 stop:357 length:123 start_codon:yes stop_codon:yes gene_type:complete
MSMKDWIREIFSTVLFIALMAMILVMLVILFPDPLLWSPS